MILESLVADNVDDWADDRSLVPGNAVEKRLEPAFSALNRHK